MSKRKIIYIINPISGTGKKAATKNLIEEKTKEQGIAFEFFPSVASGDYSFLVPIIKEKQVTDVVIIAGDGTVRQVIGSLRHCNVSFGIIPSGSGNGLAYAAKISRQKTKALNVIFKNNVMPTDGFLINQDFSCMLCGLGFDAVVAHSFSQQPVRGVMTYAKEIFKHLFLAKTFSFQLKLNGKSTSVDAYFISIANSNQFGNNFTIAPLASLHDGLLDIVILLRQNKLSLFFQTLKQAMGGNKPQKEVFPNTKKAAIYFQANEINIKNISNAPLHIDGDPAETPEELTIKVLPKCFNLLVP